MTSMTRCIYKSFYTGVLTITPLIGHCMTFTIAPLCQFILILSGLNPEINLMGRRVDAGYVATVFLGCVWANY